MYPKHSVDLYDSYLDATAKLHGYLVRDELLSFRTELFPDESPFPIIYDPIDYETNRSNFHKLHVLRAADPKFHKGHN